MRRTVSYDDALAATFLADSYSRFGVVCEFYPIMNRLDWWRLLGENWSGCDNLTLYAPILFPILRRASRAELDAMMTDDERVALAAMPEAITVYRGCYKRNRRGASWSTGREVAARFPTLIRYRGVGDPLLLTGMADRGRSVLKLDRGENEVISPDVRVISTEQLPSTFDGGCMSAANSGAQRDAARCG